MRNLFALALLGSALALTACSDDDDTGTTTPPLPGDTTAPQITFAEGRDSFRPDQGETRGTTASHMHIRFRVMDESPLEEVRAAIRGEYIGNVPEEFHLLEITDVYTAEDAGSPFYFPSGSTELNVDSDETDVYWFGPQSRPGIDAPLIAGPYEFTIRASDTFGNETPADEIVMKRFFIARSYAPVIEVSNLMDGELVGEENEALNVEGTISAGEGNLAGALAFIWVRLVNEDEHDDFSAANPLAEVIWGTSRRVSSLPTGLPVPAGDIDLAAALSGDNAIVLPDGHGHYDLIVWAEDEHGNVSRATVEVHAD